MAKLKDRYDAVVIGAGIGGLTCAALLAKAGLNVLVAEQGSKPGGCCGSFQRDGFTFDAGFDASLGCEEGGAVYNILDELALRNEIEFIKLPTSMRIMGSSYDVPVTSIEALTQNLKSMFPAETGAIDAFFGECQALASEMAGLMSLVPELLGFGGKVGLIAKFLFKSPKLRKYGGKSAKEVFDVFFKEPKLKIILNTVSPFPPEAMAPLAMNMLGGAAVGSYPKGGAQALANAFAKGVTKYGGDLALNTMVDRILIEDGKAAGIQLANGNQIRSRYVVSNADGRETFLKLVGEEHLSQNFIRELKETRLSGSFFLVSLGVDLDLKAKGFDGVSIIYNRSDDINEIFSTDLEKCYLGIMMHSLRDPSLAPQNMTTVQLKTMLPYDYMGNWKREKDGTLGRQYEELKEAVADKLIASADDIVPDLSRHIVVKDIATPLTFERYTLNSEGAGMGWFPSPGGKTRSQKTPIKGLYQAGAWTSPGPSIYATATSGKNAAQLVLKGA